jgi:hypothetical protein
VNINVIEAMRAVERANDPDTLYEAHEALYEAVADEVATEERHAQARAAAEARRDPVAEATVRAERIANGECVIETQRRCITHNAVADFGHYLDVSPSHSSFGIATND